MAVIRYPCGERKLKLGYLVDDLQTFHNFQNRKRLLPLNMKKERGSIRNCTWEEENCNNIKQGMGKRMKDPLAFLFYCLWAWRRERDNRPLVSPRIIIRENEGKSKRKRRVRISLHFPCFQSLYLLFYRIHFALFELSWSRTIQNSRTCCVLIQSWCLHACGEFFERESSVSRPIFAFSSFPSLGCLEMTASIFNRRRDRKGKKASLTAPLSVCLVSFSQTLIMKERSKRKTRDSHHILLLPQRFLPFSSCVFGMTHSVTYTLYFMFFFKSNHLFSSSLFLSWFWWERRKKWESHSTSPLSSCRMIHSKTGMTDCPSTSLYFFEWLCASHNIIISSLQLTHVSLVLLLHTSISGDFWRVRSYMMFFVPHFSISTQGIIDRVISNCSINIRFPFLYYEGRWKDEKKTESLLLILYQNDMITATKREGERRWLHDSCLSLSRSFESHAVAVAVVLFLSFLLVVHSLYFV